jgi:predicted Zn-dependent protease
VRSMAIWVRIVRSGVLTVTPILMPAMVQAQQPQATAQTPGGESPDRHWQDGMRAYERDDYAAAALGFAAVAEARPHEGMVWAMLGLCEYKLARPDEALAHIQRARTLGIAGDAQFRQVVQYHEAVLLAGRSEFERAQEILAALAESGVSTDTLIRALGMAVLRVRPADAAADAAVVSLTEEAGRAEQLLATKQFDRAAAAYRDLADRHRTTRNVQYALGRYYVATRQPAQAAAAFEREIANSPDHVPARLGLAAIKKDSDPAAALAYAEQAVRLNPRIPLGHYLLGSLLLQTPDTMRAIAELELAEQSVREDPGLYYALARAYARAGRNADAERARATFRRLTDERQRAARKQP